MGKVLSFRTKGGNVAETLAGAQRQAEELKATHAIVVIFRRPDDQALPEYLRAICSDGISAELANWIVDKLKAAIMC